MLAAAGRAKLLLKFEEADRTFLRAEKSIIRRQRFGFGGISGHQSSYEPLQLQHGHGSRVSRSVDHSSEGDNTALPVYAKRRNQWGDCVACFVQGSEGLTVANGEGCLQYYLPSVGSWSSCLLPPAYKGDTQGEGGSNCKTRYQGVRIL